eukprot:6199579-Pleurochrysis_carterae.AAC.1
MDAVPSSEQRLMLGQRRAGRLNERRGVSFFCIRVLSPLGFTLYGRPRMRDSPQVDAEADYPYRDTAWRRGLFMS